MPNIQKKQVNKEQLVKKHKIKILQKRLEEVTGKKVILKQLKEERIKDDKGSEYESEEDYDFWNKPLSDLELENLEDEDWLDDEDDEINPNWDGRIKR